MQILGQIAGILLCRDLEKRFVAGLAEGRSTVYVKLASRRAQEGAVVKPSDDIAPRPRSSTLPRNSSVMIVPPAM